MGRTWGSVGSVETHWPNGSTIFENGTKLYFWRGWGWILRKRVFSSAHPRRSPRAPPRGPPGGSPEVPRKPPRGSLEVPAEFRWAPAKFPADHQSPQSSNKFDPFPDSAAYWARIRFFFAPNHPKEVPGSPRTFKYLRKRFLASGEP